MERKLILTQDGSHSVHVPTSNLSYHSIYGAVQESMHVFIEAGLKTLLSTKQEIRVFEMGFGTGLNALLTFIESEKEKKEIYYNAIEAFPLGNDIIEKINFCEQLNRTDLQPIFEQLHDCPWEKNISLNSSFVLHKTKADFIQYNTDEKFDIIYYDAFDPVAQPDLWNLSIFEKLFNMLLPNGILVTYCSKGIIRRAMQEAKFIVEKLPGPKYKREIMRARINK
ncbi:MAG: tRNA (5-methylaminomethyl-2-thiouridine)(34)-methyltransferase MnmD [Bacteroidetes bacterium]|nr:tRNA (5-methylaminomethyl-2-thiouridine)(34)-methyltransferase MnmD [Bacteroidota bacterium]